MDLASLLLALALALAVAAFILRPLLAPRRAPTDTVHSRNTELVAARERLLTAIRDLDFDHATGKIADEDHAAQRARLVAEGAAVLRELDRLGAIRPEADPSDVEAEIEIAVATYRRRTTSASPQGLDGVACRNCGRERRPGDQFCAHCGTPFVAEAERR